MFEDLATTHYVSRVKEYGIRIDDVEKWFLVVMVIGVTIAKKPRRKFDHPLAIRDTDNSFSFWA